MQDSECYSNSMLEFNSQDRDRKAPTGFQNFYTFPATVFFDNTEVIKIGSNSQISGKGRLAWNEYCNDGYHKYGLRGRLFNDEAGRIKITEAVSIPNIYKELLVKTSVEGIRELERDLRKYLTPYKFPDHINFSGKTEYVIANKKSYIIIDEFFKFLNNNYECR